ncbi:type IV pilin [Salinadaptatus halalkaliphilus]|uniref:Type IV pilin n=1 Tax=Salinadaptatus halalkaliphilus TaxID=2419781 RepID=A0A4S3THF0_9EURY|nr:type IV pilin N-terminal domain-containing protein [Salinadaptatus halalkaliphilus]THE63399.1 type IV pilin [Salinadaptatus halalkaliphilus]
MFRRSHGHRAVSPVIGIILLVAVTVILAATIAGFAMGMDVGNEDIQAGVTIDVQSATNTIVVEVVTLGNTDHVDIVGEPADGLDGGASISESDLEELDVGDTVRINHDDLESGAESGRITVLGVKDGNEQVVASEDYDLS